MKERKKCLDELQGAIGQRKSLERYCRDRHLYMVVMMMKDQ